MIGLLLSLCGIYAIVSYSVVQRKHEIGIRMALGARGANIMGDVFLSAFRLCAIGIGGGLVLAVLCAQFLTGTLSQLSGLDPVSAIIVIMLMLLTVFAAALGPALRATKVDPAIALRS